jgi:hypothetical protein
MKLSELKNIRVNNLKDKKSLLSIVLNLSLLILILYPLLSPRYANAVVTESFVRFDRLATGAAISGTACLKTATTGTETAVVITFPQGWTINSTASNWTTTGTNLPTDPVGGGAATIWPGLSSAQATSVSGLNVVFPGTDLTPGTFYCFNFAGASSTVGSAGNDKTGQLKTQGGTPYVDIVDWATSVVSSGADQITVSASVSATMTFSLSANSVALGTISTSAISSGTVTQTVTTNARNGFVSWIKGLNWNGLYSPTANAQIFSLGTYPQTGTLTTNGTVSGYGIDAQPGTNTPTIAAGYQGSATTVGHIDTNFRQVASLTGAQSGTTVTLNVRASISATQSAANDYADTLTVVAAGSF